MTFSDPYLNSPGSGPAFFWSKPMDKPDEFVKVECPAVLLCVVRKLKRRESPRVAWRGARVLYDTCFCYQRAQPMHDPR